MLHDWPSLVLSTVLAVVGWLVRSTFNSRNEWHESVEARLQALEDAALSGQPYQRPERRRAAYRYRNEPSGDVD